jgi:thioredoxin 1
MNTAQKTLILLLLVGAIAGTLVLKIQQQKAIAEPEAETPASPSDQAMPSDASKPEPEALPALKGIPKMVDLGADKCVPCKLMAPILEELKQTYAGVMDIEFIDVWKNPDAGDAYEIQIIPTQIFYDAQGKELFRHEGFFGREDILGKWKELGVEIGAPQKTQETVSRWEPVQPDQRPKDSICYLCDGDIDPKTRTVMKTPAGDVGFCSPHCYIITFESVTDEGKTHENTRVTDWSTGEYAPLVAATFLHGMDADGRPAVKTFSSEEAATKEQRLSGGNLLPWKAFEATETATRCGFCDRPVYPSDASVVRVDGMQTWGCCEMCALGVAARTGKDIEVEAKDAHTGDPIRVITYEGQVGKLEPATAVAWGGARKDAEGKIKSAGCFKQAFFRNSVNLKKWLKEHPAVTGREMSIAQALAAKMKLTPQQISKACKIGECTPK